MDLQWTVALGVAIFLGGFGIAAAQPKLYIALANATAVLIGVAFLGSIVATFTLMKAQSIAVAAIPIENPFDATKDAVRKALASYQDWWFELSLALVALSVMHWLLCVISRISISIRENKDTTEP